MSGNTTCMLQYQCVNFHKLYFSMSSKVSDTSDFIWPFLGPYMGVIPNPKLAFIFPISCILALIFPILIKYLPECEEKGSFLKSQIKSLDTENTNVTCFCLNGV